MKKLMTILTISTGLVMAGFSGAVFADAVPVTEPVVTEDPAAYVTVDAGTGFVLTLDADDEVIAAEAVDESGAAVLEGVDLTGQPVDEALSQLIDEAIAEGVLPTDGSVPVEVTVITEDSIAEEPTESAPDAGGDGTEPVSEEDALTDAIEDALEDVTEELDVPVVVTYQNAALERVAMAKALGITPGKLNLIQKYAATVENPETVVVADWTGKSVKEIMAAIKANRKASTPSGTPDGIDSEEPPVTEEPDEVTQTVQTDRTPKAAVEKTNSKAKSGGNGGGKGKSGK